MRPGKVYGNLWLAVLAVLVFVPAGAAEIRGRVSFSYEGMFKVDGRLQERPIAVALLEMDGRQTVLRDSREHQVEISGNRIEPSFMTIQRGDTIKFVNRDGVYHQLFSVSSESPFDVTLAKSGHSGLQTASVTLNKAGTSHIFCRIHNKSYARIDVLDTPYQQIVKAGEEFHFSNLRAGRWMLRLASPAAETRMVAVDAVTSPPSLNLQLSSRGGGSGSVELSLGASIDSMYQ